MKFIKILTLFFLVQSLWSQEVHFDEENGFLKITESFDKNFGEYSEDIKKVTYIRAAVLSSIQLTLDDENKPIIFITTEELVANGESREYKVYSIPVIDSLKKIEREIDKVLTKIDIPKIDQ